VILSTGGNSRCELSDSEERAVRSGTRYWANGCTGESVIKMCIERDENRSVWKTSFFKLKL